MKRLLVTLSLLFLPVVRAIVLTAEERTFSAATPKTVADILRHLLSCNWQLQPLYKTIKSDTITARFSRIGADRVGLFQTLERCL